MPLCPTIIIPLVCCFHGDSKLHLKRHGCNRRTDNKLKIVLFTLAVYHARANGRARAFVWNSEPARGWGLLTAGMKILAYLQQLLRPVWSIISIEYPLLVTQKGPRHSNKIRPVSHWQQTQRGDRRSFTSSRAISASKEYQLKSVPWMGETKQTTDRGEHRASQRRR